MTSRLTQGIRGRDRHYAFVGVWEYQGEAKEPTLQKEPLVYEEVNFSTRSYK
ncbi:MAG: hypothetical protein RI580_01730 [Halothece sp. Uz-M2-17]|nr:hypothetical protein [Halothece sp. Uz-M2-17]